jgi:hypothetical protein
VISKPLKSPKKPNKNGIKKILSRRRRHRGVSRNTFSTIQPFNNATTIASDAEIFGTMTFH